jgi:hypothetical protein
MGFKWSPVHHELVIIHAYITIIPGGQHDIYNISTVQVTVAESPMNIVAYRKPYFTAVTELYDSIDRSCFS